MSAIGIIKILSGFMICLITFIAHYLSIEKIIITALFLAIGNSLGDYFGNAALAKEGQEVTGAFSSFSGQLFNNLIGFSISAYKSGSNTINLFSELLN